MTITCLFDINETVLDLSALDGLFAELFGDPHSRVLWFAQTLQNAMTAELCGRHAPFATQGQAALDMLGERLGRPLGAADKQRVADALKCLPAHPDVRPALAFAHEHGVRCIAFSNNARSATQVQLAAAGLADGFAAILSAEDAAALKPATATYRQAAATLGQPADTLWLIAVHAWDIAGAQAAGLKGALVQRTAEQVANPLAPPLVIGRDLQEAMALILAHEDRHP
ncbi:haloacid dehalogenase type II [Pseudomonas oryzihabitans]|uniref:haloacid dehalogenase type II n=1 Tax=Pseudomonas oryzihabitans TaxID=47885 RepID=UPI00111E14BA|nr:haloacid dehalogenase type II [Pseudomonas psychrotolerans]QDD91629.1 haloacid dehalogenase, type II [Pseudomonas psychrotolerans]